MPVDPFTAAELDAGARAVGKLRHFMDTDGWPSIRICGAEDEARAVLDAVTLTIERRAQIPLLSLIEDLHDPEPCWYDHHGNCQAHGTTERPCPHERAKRVLAKARVDGTLTTKEHTDG